LVIPVQPVGFKLALELHTALVVTAARHGVQAGDAVQPRGKAVRKNLVAHHGHLVFAHAKAAAGNGLLVSGSETDTFANVLKSQEQEAQADIQTIKANTALNVWSREEQARSYLVAAQQSRYGATSSLLSSSNYSKQAKYAYNNGVTSAAGSALSGIGSAAVGVNGLAKETGGYQWGGK